MTHIPSVDRRQQFIEAATRVIEKHGVAKATTRSIAQEAGAPLPALHYCFGTKEELFEAVSDTFGKSGLTPALENVRAGMGIAAAVAVVFESAWNFIAANLSSELAELEIYVWSLRTGRKQLAKHAYDSWLEFVQDALEVARTEDELDQDIPLIARMVAALTDGYALMDLMRGEQRLEDSADVASRTVAAALDAGVYRRG
ncbi:TetR/AcrR family transcriptional regulator [Rhodococcus koreensis]